MNKPVKPNITIPAEFATNGVKTDFDNSKLTDGFDRINPDVLAGDNLNKFIDDTYKGLNYSIAGTDAINLIQEGEVLTVKDGELVSGSISGLPIGTIYPVVCTADYVPTGGLPTDGTEYTKSQFPNLWENYLTANTPLLNTCTYAEYANDILTYGQCGKFAIDEINETFKVPTIKDGSYITQANSDNELGKSYNESLPNVTGQSEGANWAVNDNNRDNDASGAFSQQQAVTNGEHYSAIWDQNAGLRRVKDVFDASRSSSTYQDNAPVQGNNVRLRYFVQVATGQINPSDMDWAAWASSLQSKLNKDVSTNISNTGKSYIAGMGMPSNKYIDLTLGASGTEYVAPANGWFYIDKLQSGYENVLALAYPEMVNGAYIFSSYLRCVGNGYSQQLSIPVRKGQPVKCNYDGNGTCRLFRFYYAVGSESEAQ